MDIQKFELDVPAGLALRTLHGQAALAYPSRRGLRPDVSSLAARGCAAHQGILPSRRSGDRLAIHDRSSPNTQTLPLPPPPVSARVVYTIEGQQGELNSVARTPMHGDKRRRVVHAAGGSAAVFGADFSGDADHCRRRESFRRPERRGAQSMPITPPPSCIPRYPAAGRCEPESASVEFARSGEHASEFKELPDGAKEGRYQVQAVVTSQGHEFSDGYSLVARPDIGGFFYYQPALQRAGRRRGEGPARSEGRLRHGRGRRHSHGAAPVGARRHSAYSRRRWSMATCSVSARSFSAFAPTTRARM